MTAKLLGFRVGTSKKSGKEYCQLHLEVEPTPVDTSNGFVGKKTQIEFAPADQIHYFTAMDIGKQVELDYSIMGGRAYLNSVTIKK